MRKDHRDPLIDVPHRTPDEHLVNDATQSPQVRAKPDGALGARLAESWSLATGLSFLAWYVFAPQCVATLGVVKRETNSWAWMGVMFAYMLTLAYLASLIVYHTAVALGAG